MSLDQVVIDYKKKEGEKPRYAFYTFKEENSARSFNKERGTTTITVYPQGSIEEGEFAEVLSIETVK